MQWISDAYAQLRERERRAGHLRQNHPLFLPGLLQTRSYATAIVTALTGRPADDASVTERVDVRMQRSAAFLERLAGPQPPELSVTLDEAVLRRPAGTADVWREQRDHLLQLTEKFPSVQVTVLPLSGGAHAGLTGPFEIVGDDGVFLETAEGDQFLTDPPVVARYRATFAALMAGDPDRRLSLSHM
ncbi:DUF5753 domain-containing protein [Actinoplanes sp. N902-109]|uniref:DUF5753 domain-containing protein n=1 Tax=Actinoplanes sp. (strain N902-109) TaxID=649831 RepID=UPI0003295073|nr:DUF5753 domain-containing protein [Actinoplanes sp. N902-109]AGL15234.1 hypothetical protein L083_1724 [Actinoplanes sp. N902-109]